MTTHQGSRSARVAGWTLVTCVSAAVCAGQTVFQPPSFRALDHSDLHSGPVHAGDIDGDGVPDLVILDGLPFTPYLFPGTPSGVLGEPRLLGAPASLNMDGIADLDGDGDADVYGRVPDPAAGPVILPPHTVGILLNRGDGTFEPMAVLPSPPANALSVDVADITGDGDLDILVSSQILFGWTKGIALYPSAGQGTFGAPVLVSEEVDSLVLGDLDGDGFADLIVAGDLLTPPLVRFGSTSGLGEAVPRPELAYETPLHVADIDLDGHVDLMTRLEGTHAPVSHGLRPGHGDGSFGDWIPLPFDGDLVEVADLSGDGVPDLLVHDHVDDEVRIHAGQGDFSFVLDLVLDWPDLSRGGTSVDMDGDGRRDLAFWWSIIDYATFSQAGVGVALNHTYGPGAPCLDVGEALPGTRGRPILLAEGAFAPGTDALLSLRNAAGERPAWLVAGMERWDAPFKGGLMIPRPEGVLELGLTAADGSLDAVTALHPDLPSGLAFWAQFWIEDEGALHGHAATPGLQVVVP